MDSDCIPNGFRKDSGSAPETVAGIPWNQIGKSSITQHRVQWADRTKRVKSIDCHPINPKLAREATPSDTIPDSARRTNSAIKNYGYGKSIDLRWYHSTPLTKHRREFCAETMNETFGEIMGGIKVSTNNNRNQIKPFQIGSFQIGRFRCRWTRSHRFLAVCIPAI